MNECNRLNKPVEIRAMVDTGVTDSYVSREFLLENYFKIQGLKLEKSEVNFDAN